MAKELNFESSIKRLEEILEKMNSGGVTLDDSLTLFEEADKLIGNCQTKLAAAEKKVKKLIKNREGDPIIGSDGLPETEDF